MSTVQNKAVSNETLNKISKAIIVNQIALNCNEAIIHTQVYKGPLKYKLNNLLADLRLAEVKEFDMVFKAAEEASVNSYAVTEEMINEIVALGLEHYENIALIIRAYNKDPKSIEGIVKKILK